MFVKGTMFAIWFAGVAYVMTHLHAAHYVDQSPRGDTQVKALLIDNGVLSP